VQRFNLARQPRAFAETPIVKEALAKEGNGCLPLTVVEGRVACKGCYPSRAMLAQYARIALDAAPNAPEMVPRCCCQAPRRARSGSPKKGTGCC